MISDQLTFHHLGLACQSVDEDLAFYLRLGYHVTGKRFRETSQGVGGYFLEGAGPRLELLENLALSETLNPYLEKKEKIYHMGYEITHPRTFNLESFLQKHDGMLIRPPIFSEYFQSKVCFVYLRNGQLLELIHLP
jgi:methylmalonyl-CoA/ethylmalonyl-CoA epimerase